MRWLLPEAIEDILPQEANRVEALRRRLLDEFGRHGYQFVMPPMLEYVESLLTGSGRDLDLRTFKLVDQASGRTMGVRADITPQVARIDAHLLNRSGVTRLCYSGSVLHTLPAGFHATREPQQIGAELYGHAGLEADIEIIRLLARTLRLANLSASRIDLGHVGLFRVLAEEAQLREDQVENVFAALQAKDLPTLRERLVDVPEPARRALLALPDLYGGPAVLARARQVLPPSVAPQLDELQRLSDALADLPVSFDLADLRGYHYHNGVVFAAYCAGSPVALALGGRYDKAGAAYGRARPATGFSMDLRELVRLGPRSSGPGAILAPWRGAVDEAGNGLNARIDSLRAEGETVVIALPGHEGSWAEAGCDRQLVECGGEWIIEVLKEA